MKGGLLLGSSILFIYGAMGISISALWAVWGVLFPVYVSLAIGIAPWSHCLSCTLGARLAHTRYSTERFMAVGGLHLHVSHSFSVGWKRGQNASRLVPLADRSALPVVMVGRLGFSGSNQGHPWISKTLQLFFPASLAMITLIGLARPPLFGMLSMGSLVSRNLGPQPWNG